MLPRGNERKKCYKIIQTKKDKIRKSWSWIEGEGMQRTPIRKAGDRSAHDKIFCKTESSNRGDYRLISATQEFERS
jgi:hypothetical protein